MISLGTAKPNGLLARWALHLRKFKRVVPLIEFVQRGDISTCMECPSSSTFTMKLSASR